MSTSPKCMKPQPHLADGFAASESLLKLGAQRTGEKSPQSTQACLSPWPLTHVLPSGSADPSSESIVASAVKMLSVSSCVSLTVLGSL